MTQNDAKCILIKNHIIMQTDYKTIASLLFPEGLLDYFDIEKYEKKSRPSRQSRNYLD